MNDQPPFDGNNLVGQISPDGSYQLMEFISTRKSHKGTWLYFFKAKRLDDGTEFMANFEASNPNSN